MSNGGFSRDFSLSKLEQQMNALVPVWGGLTKIDNDGQQTIGVYDNAAAAATIRLRPGNAAPLGGQRVISTGKVFILGSLQVVTAYAV